MQAAIVVVVMLYLLNRLRTLGWHNTWVSLPRTPWFYLVFACNYLIVPLADTSIYSLIIKHNLFGSLNIFIRKMIYNDVVDYSGEAYLAVWLKRQFNLDTPATFSMLKDVNLLSSLAGNIITLSVVAAFVLSGQLGLLLNVGPDVRHYLVGGVGLGMVMIIAMILLRRQLLGLDMTRTVQVLCIHLTRALAALGLLTLQWSVALPSVPLGTWFVFLTGGAVLGRIPFLPNRNLMFMGLAVAMTGLVNVPKAHISGVFLASGGLALAVSATLMLVTSFKKSKEQTH